MPDSGILWVLDTSIWVSYLRSGKYSGFIARAFRKNSIFLPGVVLCELYAGAVNNKDRADLEGFRRALGRNLVSSAKEDWVVAGRCLAHYSACWERIKPRDHLAEVLVAVAASKIRAALATENLEHMIRWSKVLKRLGRRLRVEPIPEE